MKQNNYRSVMQVPRITKITVNMGLGEATQNAKVLDVAAGDLSTITGQKAVDHQGAQEHLEFQTAPGFGYRLRWSRCAASACTSFLIV